MFFSANLKVLKKLAQHNKNKQYKNKINYDNMKEHTKDKT